MASLDNLFRAARAAYPISKAHPLATSFSVVLTPTEVTSFLSTGQASDQHVRGVQRVSIEPARLTFPFTAGIQTKRRAVGFGGLVGPGVY